MNDYFMSKPEPEERSEDELIEAIFTAADAWIPASKERDRRLADAIDEAMSHAYAEGRADEKREAREAEFEKAARAMNETGQGEHGVTHGNSQVHPMLADILNHFGPRRAA